MECHRISILKPRKPDYLPDPARRSVDPGEVAFAFGFEPIEHLGIEADADRLLAPRTTQPHHVRELIRREPRNVRVVDVRIVACGLLRGPAPHRFLFGLSPLPVSDIF
jgi:hypothetical protein